MVFNALFNNISILSCNQYICCTAEGADKYETGTNVTRTTKKTALTTFMKGEEWRLFQSFLLKSDKFSDIFDIAG